MLSAVWWGLARGFCFCGILIILAMYSMEVLNWMVNFENSIANIKPIALKDVEDEKGGISAMVIGIFVVCWAIIAVLAGIMN